MKKVSRKKKTSSTRSPTKKKVSKKKVSKKKAEKVTPRGVASTPSEDAEQLKRNIEAQLDSGELPRGFQTMDTDLPKNTYYVWVRGQKQYPKLKFSCVDESEAIRQYRSIVKVANPTKYNYGCEKHSKN